MPHYRRRRNYRHRAASRIQSAWRRKKRKRFGLTTRTVLSNRRAIKGINRQIETIVESNITGVSPDWIGQMGVNLSTDRRGTETNSGLPYFGQLCAATQNTNNTSPIYGIKGRWVQMKSLTIKGSVSANSDTGSSQYQRQTFIVCLDRKPQLGLSQLLATTISPDLGLLQSDLPVAVTNRTSLAFYNLNNTGKEGRFKVLKRWSVVVSPTVDLGDAAGPQQVPAITTTAAGVAPNVYGNTVRPAYTVPQLGLSKKYPPLVYFSHTIKGKYKFNYGEQTTHPGLPQNQQIVMFAFSDNGPGLTDTQPVFTYASRFRFKDP